MRNEGRGSSAAPFVSYRARKRACEGRGFFTGIPLATYGQALADQTLRGGVRGTILFLGFSGKFLWQSAAVTAPPCCGVSGQFLRTQRRGEYTASLRSYCASRPNGILQLPYSSPLGSTDSSTVTSVLLSASVSPVSATSCMGSPRSDSSSSRVGGGMRLPAGRSAALAAFAPAHPRFAWACTA